MRFLKDLQGKLVHYRQRVKEEELVAEDIEDKIEAGSKELAAAQEKQVSLLEEGRQVGLLFDATSTIMEDEVQQDRLEKVVQTKKKQVQITKDALENFKKTCD